MHPIISSTEKKRFLRFAPTSRDFGRDSLIRHNAKHVQCAQRCVRLNCFHPHPGETQSKKNQCLSACHTPHHSPQPPRTRTSNLVLWSASFRNRGRTFPSYFRPIFKLPNETGISRFARTSFSLFFLSFQAINPRMSPSRMNAPGGRIIRITGS